MQDQIVLKSYFENLHGEGVIIKGQDLLKQSTTRHFQLLFQDDGLSDEEVSSDFLFNVPSLTSVEDNYILMKTFSEKEIVDVIWAMESDKAPGLNDFSFHFYKVCWPIIKTDLVRMVTAFQNKSKVGVYKLYISCPYPQGSQPFFLIQGLPYFVV